MSPLYPAQGQAALWLVFAAAGALCAAVSKAVTAFFGGGRMRVPGAITAGAVSALIGCGTCVLFASGLPRAYMLPALAMGAVAFHWLVAVPLGKAARLVARILLRIKACAAELGAVKRLLK